MRTIVHLSDIHFGSVNEAVIGPLIQTINDLKPDVVTVSGDLTQRAKSQQFEAARAFLDVLPGPQIVVPGNHDIPLFNLYLRFAQPLKRYHRYITLDMRPAYVDDQIAIMGVNTARSLTIKGGRINRTQAMWLREQFCAIGPQIVKVVVTHHPFDLPAGRDVRDIVGRSRMAIEELSSCGVDMFLAGHLHISYSGHMAKRYNLGGNTAIVVQAGTAASTRARGEGNSFNVIRIEQPDIAIERLTWQPTESRFISAVTDRFRRSSDGWSRQER
jgi:3',5'-cyclic AMP phosphodiesterase CpdA